MLIFVRNDESDLCFNFLRLAIETRDGDQLVVDLGHQGKTVDVVDAGETLHLLRRQLRMEGEES